MPRKVSKEAYELIIDRIQEDGYVSTDEIVDFVEPFYDFDPRSARKREVRQWVGQLVRRQRDAQGVRKVFLEKTNAEIVDIEVCEDASKIDLVGEQLMLQARGLWRSCKKAKKRKLELNNQVSMFDETALLLDLSGAN